MEFDGLVEETLALRMVRGMKDLCKRPAQRPTSEATPVVDAVVMADAPPWMTPALAAELELELSAEEPVEVPEATSSAAPVSVPEAQPVSAYPMSGRPAAGSRRRSPGRARGFETREAPPGARRPTFVPRKLASLGLAAAAIVPFAGGAVGALATIPSAAPAAASTIYTGTPPVVDGKLDPIYSSAFSAISYTETGGNHSVANGQLAVIETPDAYYIGFQQGLTFKSNAYCATKGTPADCYQKFGDLVGSDHISFIWSVSGKTIQVGVDIISQNSSAQYGYSGTVKSPLTGNIGEGLSLLGCDPSGVTGFSGMDYNWHHAGPAGWGADPQATTASPNFVGKAALYPDYVYPSTAEVRLSKAACGLANGTDMTHPSIIAHDSPEAPWSSQPQQFLVCDSGNPTVADVGQTANLTVNLVTVDSNGNSTPTVGKPVVTGISAGSAQITGINGVANTTKGTSTSAGKVVISVTSATAGTSSIWAAADLNGNGTWDQASEPVTNPSCNITFQAGATQTISGHIYDCSNGVATTLERLGGALAATGPETVSQVGNPLSPKNVASGAYTMTATAPANFEFVTCGGAATPGSPPTTATTSVTVPPGGTGVGIFYVAPATTPTQTIAGHIYDCSNGVATTTERLGGSLFATGPQFVPSTANPMAPLSVLAGTYTMSASAPANYQFVTCGGAAVPGSPPTTATTSVTVPSGGTGVGIFYVAPATTPTQTIAGHIYDCSNGVATTTERLGGSLFATGPQFVPSTANPMAPLSVLAGTYTMSASAPANYQFVTCGGAAVPGSPPTTATTSVTVPSGGAGVGIFYVAPATTPTQTIAGHIYDCSNGVATTTERLGGALWANGPQFVPTVGNPMAPTSVLAGTYTMAAVAPANYQFVTCGGAAVPGSPPTTATTSVTVPSGGAGVGIFYVAPTTTPNQTIAGHIYDCTNGVATTTERLGGSLSASGPQNLPAVGNPMSPTGVLAGTYTMAAAAPAGYQFVTCGGAATPGSPPTTATTSVTVPVGGAGVGIFYVVPSTTPTQTIAGHIYDCSGGVATTLERLGGALWANGPQFVPGVGNPMVPTSVLAGTYTMSASAPAGYQFVTCGSSAVPGSPPVTATTSVLVPTNGSGVGIFYVVPSTTPTQTIAGHIYDCSGGVATTLERLGGTLWATGPQFVPFVGNPMAPTSVLAGAYTMSASAPAGYEFVTCGGPATPGSPPTTATTSVLVPTNGSGVGVFYVAPSTTPTQTITGHIYDCTGGVVTTFERTGGTLAATGPMTVPAVINPMPSTSVLAGTYTMTATAPPGYQFVTCGGTSVVGDPPTTATTSVVVPPNGTGTGLFYVVPVPITITAVKVNNADGQGNWLQTETAPTSGAAVPFRVTVTNTSAVPVVVTSLTDAWPNQTPFSPQCATAVVGTVLNPGSSATCEFTVSGYSPPAGQSVVNTATVTACQVGGPGNCASAAPTSTVNSVQVLGETLTPITPSTPTVTPTTPGQLAFTGPPNWIGGALKLALALLGLGALLVWLPRRRPASSD